MSQPQWDTPVLDYRPEKGRLRLRRWLRRGIFVLVGIGLVGGVVWRDELRRQWQDLQTAYHDWRADVALLKLLDQQDLPGEHEYVYDSTAPDPVLRAAPKHFDSWQHHFTAASGQPTLLTVTRPNTINAWTPQPLHRYDGEAFLAIGRIERSADAMGTARETLGWLTANDTLIVAGTQDVTPILGVLRVSDAARLHVDIGDKRLRWAMGRVGSDPSRTMTVPFELDGKLGQLSLMKAPSSYWRSRRFANPMLLRGWATHGWIETPTYTNKSTVHAGGHWHADVPDGVGGVAVDWRSADDKLEGWVLPWAAAADADAADRKRSLEARLRQAGLGFPIFVSDGGPDGPAVAIVAEPRLASFRARADGTFVADGLVVVVNGAGARRLLRDERPASAVSLSPDGKLAALADYTADGYGFSVVDVATGTIVVDVHTLTLPIDHAPPAWSPDGRRVALVGQHHVYVIDVPQQTALQIPKPTYAAGLGGQAVYEPQWFGFQVALSADGSRVAYLCNRHGVSVAEVSDMPVR
ncbi:MAG: hypothetical protein AAGD32_13990 [Planctomycetota bacterium]